MSTRGSRFQEETKVFRAEKQDMNPRAEVWLLGDAIRALRSVNVEWEVLDLASFHGCWRVKG